MKKYGLKAFVISFFASLFIMFFISKALVSEKNVAEDKVIVPASNIVLFFNSDMPKAYSAKTSPIKKIVLNTPLEVPQTQESVEPVLALADVVVPEVESSGVSPLVVDEAVEVVEASFVEQGVVPLTYENPSAKFEKIIDDYADFIKKPAAVSYPAKAEELNKNLEGKKMVYSAAETVENVNIPLLKDKKLVFAEEAKVVDDGFLVAKTAEASVVEKASDAIVLDTSFSGESIGQEQSAWVTMDNSQKAEEQTPWKEVKGVKFPKNKKVLETDGVFVEKKNNASSSKISKNILIPLPEDVEKNPDALPLIMSSEKEESLNEVSVESSGNLEGDEKKATKLLKGISKLFTKAGESVEKEIKDTFSEVVDVVDPPESGSSYAFEVGSSFSAEIMPTEIRLSFAPNKAEISGHTVNWLGAFAEKSKEDGVGLEIRIDGTSSQALQQKRLNLIYNILSTKGASAGKVKTVFTNREPNSFVIRAVKSSEFKGGDYRGKQSYQQW